uniref:hypothetical protein n=1 Tax=Pseudonocardia sp. CA-138482 TaxID=3240023 RepID=UPI003F4979B1
MTVLLGAAVLLWLAGAVLTGLADTTSDPARSPVVVAVAAADGSPDDQSAGGAPSGPAGSRVARTEPPARAMIKSDW